MISLKLKIPPLALMVISALAIRGLAVVFPADQLEIPSNLWIAAIFTVAGILFPLGGVLSFHRARTTVDPRFPEQSVQLVKTGIYQFSRNPMYLGFLLLLTGWAFYLASWPGFLLLPLFILYLNRFQIEPEEKILRQKFGDSYRDYQDSVRRWI